MSGFASTYECKVDTKGRVLFPARLQEELDEVMSGGFIIKRSIFNQCIELWPKSYWDKELEKINRLNRYLEKNIRFIRKFLAGVKHVELDKNGRLLIPRHLIEFAGIGKNIVIASMIDKIEIWDKEKYELDQVMDDDFKMLAEDVMGSLGNTQTTE